MTLNLRVELLGGSVPNPLMNAAGVYCYKNEDLLQLAHSSCGTLVTKSCTLEPREGNPEPRYRDVPLGSINSMGLPNLGLGYYLDYAEHHHPFSAEKPLLFLSLSGLSLNENISMLKILKEHIERLEQSSDKKIVLELNLSCPNIVGKPQLAYDFDAMKECLKEVSEQYGLPFGVKLPPYFDMAHFDMAAAVVNAFPLVQFVTCINSIGNGLLIDIESESVLIKPKHGFGGLGGSYVLPTALANVNAFYRRCPQKLVFGCGGVTSGEEVFMHVLAGATLVQVGTQLHSEGPAIFPRLLEELSAIMKRKGYHSLSEFRGKLKVLN